MSNIPAQFDRSSPEGIVKAPKGARFIRHGEKFYVSHNGRVRELSISKKSLVQAHYSDAGFPTLKESDISFSKPNETWVKTGNGNNDIGWRYASSANSFVSIVNETNPIMGDIIAVGAGYYQSYFLKTNGDLWASGYNSDGELGNGTTDYRNTASLVLTDVKTVRASCEGWFASALKNDGTLWFAGYGYDGQFGNGTNDSYNDWTQNVLDGDITGSGAITDIAVGEYYTALLMADGTVWATGDAFNISTNVFMQITGSVKAIAGGGYHLLYINNSDVLFGIGENWDNQLGSEISPFYNWDEPFQIDTGVKAVGAGGYHSGYIKNDDTLWMMGGNWDGQIGINPDVEEHIHTPMQVDTNVRYITGGDSHTLYIKNDNTLWGMGYNGDGELGVYPWYDIYPATQIATDVSSVVAGNEHSLYVKTNKLLYGMGYNWFFQMGGPVYPFGMFSTNPLTGWTADGVTKFNYYDNQFDEHRWRGSVYGGGKFIVGGGEGNTQIRYSTDAKIWNTGSIDNVEGGISGVAYGAGKYVAVSGVSDGWNDGRPETFTSTDGITWTSGSLINTEWHELNAVVYGGGQFVAAGDRRIVTSPDGDTWTEQSTPANNYIRCLAYGDGKYVAGTWWGDYDINYEWYSYSQSFNNQTVDAFAAGRDHSLALKSGTLYGCGLNDYGQLGFGGYGDFGHYSKFLPITTNVKTVAAGYDHTTFVKNDGTLWGMGYNGFGQLGNGTFNSAFSPIQIDTNVSQSFGNEYGQNTLYIKNDNTLWGMGYNGSGQLGITSDSYVTQSVQVDTNVVSAAVGEEYSMYIKSDGTLYTIGQNNWGQLGDGTNNDSNTPISVDTSVRLCAAGGNTAFYVKNNGNLYGMGYNGHGQLGQGDTTARNTPTLIDTEVVSVSANNSSVVYVKEDGTAYGIGYNENGRLGTGDDTNHNTPTVSNITDAKQAHMASRASMIVKTDNTLWVVGYGDTGNLGLVSTAPKGVYSADGTNWSSSYMPDDWNAGIAYGNGIFVATGDQQTVITSANGIDWDYNYISTSSYFDPRGVIFDGTKFIVFADGSDNQMDIATSTDGINWTLGSTGTNSYWNTMVYGDGKYAIFADGWNNYVNPPYNLTIE